MLALRAFAAILSYPSDDLRCALADVRSAIATEPRMSRDDVERIDALIAWLGRGELIDRQEAYVALFDRGRATSLNLYDHIHGDSRDRGQAMVDLVNVYRTGGLALATGELPDHLPVLVEYLSTRPYVEVREMLADCAHLLRRIGDALAQRQSHYASVLGALLSLAGERGLDHASGIADEDVSIDDEWIEPPVLFGLGCGDARERDGAKPVRFVHKAA